jgi:hypothetical protein
MRDLEITTTADLPEGEWRELVDKCDGYEFKEGTFCEFELAEEVIGFLRFNTELGPQFEVGIGEALRPYIELYAGNDVAVATSVFWTAVQVRAHLGEATVLDEDGDYKP